MNEMEGLDKAEAAAYIVKHLEWKRCPKLKEQAAFLVPALVEGQVGYLHACGALDEAGNTGDGEYDEDEAVEFILNRLTEAFQPEDDTAVLYCALIDAFLPAFDDYLVTVGLLEW
ncbi:MAG: hypothetical protein MJ136_07565 [Clostridia bacterium]|nr:hypothetical protein [Clostridia bacterium]